MNTLSQQLKKIPSTSGIYFFKDTKGEIIYIGKAVNLKARVKSYFSQKLYGLKAVMIPEIAKIDYKITDTEIDALILESQYIKKHRPKYNVMLKDDKNYFYVVITPHPSRIAQGANPQLSLKGEGPKFPKIFITHQPNKVQSLTCPTGSSARTIPARMILSGWRSDGFRRELKVKSLNTKEGIILGPYTDGAALKTTLKFLRKIFPYCTCKSQHKLPCLKAHLGLCLGVCCTSTPTVILRPSQTAEESRRSPPVPKRYVRAGFISLRMTYKKNIKSIIDILSGRKKSILAKLEREMRTAAKKENFEKAADIRNKISALKNIFEHKIIDVGHPYYGRPTSIMKELKGIFGGKIGRIEFYDISNIQGQLATGSMVVFDNGKIDKSQYRKFKIKTVHQSDDPAMMREVLERRLKHTDWPMPDLIIVDGGITQLNAAKNVLACRGSTSAIDEVEPRTTRTIKIASLAKNPDRLFFSPLKAIALKDLPENTRLLLQNLRNEAHRFAIGYHKKLRSKKLKYEFGYLL